jgi:hypothetical protein
MSELLTAEDIFANAPLGARIGFTDSQPEPPVRHVRRHAAWKDRNSAGILLNKLNGQSGAFICPNSFQLETKVYYSATAPIVHIQPTFLVGTKLRFKIDALPMENTYRIIRFSGAMTSLIATITNRDSALPVMEKARISDGHVELRDWQDNVLERA